MSRPIIGITTNSFYHSFLNIDSKYVIGNNHDYIYSIEKAGGIPILLPITLDEDSLLSFANLCDGFLFAGGDDINPILYGEEPHKLLGQTCTQTDKCHIALLEHILPLEKPLLGICRGMQLLNIVCGGNVYQDLSEYPRESIKHSQTSPRYDSTHSIMTEDQSILNVLLGDTFATNSFHHQAIHHLGKNITATAWSKDRIIEGIELTDHPFAVGVQWHPEIMLHESDNMLPLFKAFINKCYTEKDNT